MRLWTLPDGMSEPKTEVSSSQSRIISTLDIAITVFVELHKSESLYQTTEPQFRSHSYTPVSSPSMIHLFSCSGL